MIASTHTTIGIIVEGQGEVQAAPALIRRIAQNMFPTITICVKVRRIPKSKLVRPCELENAVNALSRQVGRESPILVLVDADDQCPVELGRDLSSRCQASHRDLKVSIVIAKREYEAWFLAASDSLVTSGHLQRSPDFSPHAESVSGAKEWLTKHMPSGQPYAPTRHQVVFSSIIDLNQARSARSFRKLEKEVLHMLSRD
jgi:hypothetical protein